MSTDMSCEVHLLVMIHGMWGTPTNLTEAKRAISEKNEALVLNLDATSAADSDAGKRLDILVARTNQESSTYDGADWGGERVAEEVYERIATIEKDGKYKVTHFSLFGYSFGGLLARYLLGILHSRKFFDSVTPVNFTTFATPHIGLPRYRSLLSTFAATVGSKILSRTGEQFYGIDKWGKEARPLLEIMADKDRIFWRALSLFPHIRIYANAVSDPTVPFVTAAIELHDPFLAVDTNEVEVKLHPDYGALIESYAPIPPVTSRFSFRSLVPTRPVLPLFLKRGVVFETAIIVLSPVVLPAMISLAVLRLARESRASRSRIQLLEADENNRTKLINMLHNVENTVEHLIDPALAEQDLPSPEFSLPGEVPPPVDDPKSLSLGRTTPEKGKDKDKDKDSRCHTSDTQPILTDAQQQMVHALNALPQMQKHFAFFHPVRNTHGLIVCRDVEEARRVGREWETFIRQGEGVLRHWADGFVV